MRHRQLHEKCWRAEALEERLSEAARAQLAAFRALPLAEDAEAVAREDAARAGRAEREAAPADDEEGVAEESVEQSASTESAAVVVERAAKRTAAENRAEIEAAPSWPAELSDGQKHARELRRAIAFPGTQAAAAEGYLDALLAVASSVAGSTAGLPLLPRDGFDPNA